MTEETSSHQVSVPAAAPFPTEHPRLPLPGTGHMQRTRQPTLQHFMVPGHWLSLLHSTRHTDMPGTSRGQKPSLAAGAQQGQSPPKPLLAPTAQPASGSCRQGATGIPVPLP